MRHNNKTKSLGRLTGHRKAMLANMACSLIEHKRITTTIAKCFNPGPKNNNPQCYIVLYSVARCVI